VKDEDGAKAEALTASRNRANTKDTREFMFGLELSNERAARARIVEVW